MSDDIWKQKGHIQEDLKLTLRDPLKSPGSFGIVGDAEDMAIMQLWGTRGAEHLDRCLQVKLGTIFSVQPEFEELAIMAYFSSLEKPSLRSLALWVC